MTDVWIFLAIWTIGTLLVVWAAKADIHGLIERKDSWMGRKKD